MFPTPIVSTCNHFFSPVFVYTGLKGLLVRGTRVGTVGPMAAEPKLLNIHAMHAQITDVVSMYIYESRYVVEDECTYTQNYMC